MQQTPSLRTEDENKLFINHFFPEDKRRELSNLSKKDNRSICNHCLTPEKKNLYTSIFKDGYWYLFDTGVCEACGETNEIIYIPLAELHVQHREFSPMDWYNKHPRIKEFIEYVINK